MPFINEILKHRSVAITGLEKNTGKTECLNYIVEKLAFVGKKIALTSIGLDGESFDQITNSHKPEITLYEGIIFITSEKHFRQAKIDAEIIDISTQRTALGRLVIAEAKSTGKAIISGPTNTRWLKEIIDKMSVYGAHTTLVDGALSRLSSASPTIAEAMILTTGASLSANMDELVNKTDFAVKLINLPEYVSPLADCMAALEDGIYSVDKSGNFFDTGIKSTFLLNNQKEFMDNATVIYTSGAVTDKLLNFLRLQKKMPQLLLVVKDFTKIFASKMVYEAFVAKGGRINLLHKSKLLAVCVNPVSPQGYILDTEYLCKRMLQKMNVAVYDIMQMENE
ncbi:MAG: hypothetical protein WBC06_06870 [Chitinophagaceae bacterium]